jgi:hypothetical protein
MVIGYPRQRFWTLQNGNARRWKFGHLQRFRGNLGVLWLIANGV